MYIEIYLDVVFIINFIMDFIVLTILCKWVGGAIPLKRKLLGATVGAIAMCIIVLIPRFMKPGYMIFSYLIVSIIIVMIVFKTTSLYEIVKLTGLMYVIAILLGGLMFFLLYYTNFGYAFQYAINQPMGNQFTLRQLFTYIIIASLLIWVLIFFIKKTVLVNKETYYVKLSLNGKEVGVNALLDTGNNLYDPITKSPVIIAQKDVVKEFFSESEYGELEALSKNLKQLGMGNVGLKKMVGLNLRLIPYTSIGNDNGLLVGIVIDQISVKVNKGYKVNEKIVLAIYNNDLCKDNSYKMLLHPNLI